MAPARQSLAGGSVGWNNGPPAAHPRRGFAFSLLLILVLIASTMALCYLLLLETWYGTLPTADETNLPAAWLNGLKVFLWDGGCPRPEAGREVAAWQDLLEREGLPFQTVSEFRQEVEPTVGVLVLPRVACLGEREEGIVDRWLEAGGGLVAVGPLGSAGAGSEASEAAWRDLLGVEAIRNLALRSPAFVTLTAQAPFALGLMPGEQWRVQAGILTVVAASAVDGYLSEGDLQPAGPGPIEEFAVVTHRAVKQGRVVWLGLGLDAVSSREKNRASWEKLCLSSVRWAGRRPLAAVSNWPGGQQVGVVIAQEVHEEEEIADALAIARSLQDRDVRPTVFLRSSLASAPAGLADLVQVAEVAVLGDREWGETAVDLAALRQMKRRLEQLSPNSVRGLRVPQGVSGNNLPEELARVGYTYYVSEPPRNSPTPQVFRFHESMLFPLDDATLVGLARVGRDDFTVLSEYEGPSYSVEGITALLQQDFERIKKVGGLYVFNYRTDLLGSPAARPALMRAIDRIMDSNAWVAPASAVADWWRQRDRINVEVKKISLRRMRVVVSNGGGKDVKNVFVSVTLPYSPQRWVVRPAVFGGQQVTSKLLSENEVLQIHIRSLKSQSVQTWTIDFN